MENTLILFVGSNPSEKAASEEPFHESTKSGKVLREWVARAGITNFKFGNIVNKATPGNRGLSKKEISSYAGVLNIQIRSLKPTHVIALGNQAAFALDICEIKHLKMPHPSGLNRKLNDPAYVEEQINKLKEYISEPR